MHHNKKGFRALKSHDTNPLQVCFSYAESMQFGKKQTEQVWYSWNILLSYKCGTFECVFDRDNE